MGRFITGTVFGALLACNSGASGDDDTTGEGPPPLTTSAGSMDSSGTGVEAQTVSLVRADAWDLAGAAEDPFADERPDFVQCEIGWDVVTSVFEVNTELCTYGAFVQPTLAPIEAGDEIEVHIQHSELDAEDSASAHIAVVVGTEIVLETEVAIPSEAGDVTETWVATVDLQVGTPIHLHLHDHGANYRVVDLTVTHR